MSTEIIDGGDEENCGSPKAVGTLVPLPKPENPSSKVDDYNKPDLARILVEGTRAVYGAEKSEQLNVEFARQRQQPAYRGNAEELTAIVDRVCGDTEVSLSTEVQANGAESIDAVVESYSGKPSMLKVAAKGTLNLAKKAHLHQGYYPLVGFLPAKYQGKIAERLGDKPLHYTVANAIAEGVAASAITSYLNSHV